MAELKAAQAERKAPEKAAPEQEVCGDNVGDESCPEETGEDLPAMGAARQKLRRLCRRRANGSLIVPLEVHQKYAAGGQERDQLLKLLIKNNLQRDS